MPSTPQPPQQAQQAVQAKCTLSESLIVLHGGSGAKHSAFTVHMSALGIKQITFYLDGHKLKTLTAAQAQKGQFNVRIDPAKLHYGAHKVSVTTVMSESVCPAIARVGRVRAPAAGGGQAQVHRLRSTAQPEGARADLPGRGGGSTAATP